MRADSFIDACNTTPPPLCIGLAGAVRAADRVPIIGSWGWGPLLDRTQDRIEGLRGPQHAMATVSPYIGAMLTGLLDREVYNCRPCTHFRELAGRAAPSHAEPPATGWAVGPAPPWSIPIPRDEPRDGNGRRPSLFGPDKGTS